MTNRARALKAAKTRAAMAKGAREWEARLNAPMTDDEELEARRATIDVHCAGCGAMRTILARAKPQGSRTKPVVVDGWVTVYFRPEDWKALSDAR